MSSIVQPVQRGTLIYFLLFYADEAGSPLGQQFTLVALTPTILAQPTVQCHFSFTHLDREDMTGFFKRNTKLSAVKSSAHPALMI